MAQDSQFRANQLPRARWRLRALLLSNLLAGAFVLTWLWGPTRAIWDAVDLAVFRGLNQSLALGRPWQLFWAIANWRLLDLAPAGVVFAIFLWTIWREPRPRQQQWWGILAVLAAVVIAVPMITHQVLGRWLQFARSSPTLALEDPVRLTQLVPWLRFKDSSPCCFPGDHGFVLIACAAFFWYFAPRRAAVAATITAVGCSLPRLASGAHWMTDIVIGGGVMALVATSWTFATPLAARATEALLPLVRRLDPLLLPWPWLRRATSAPVLTGANAARRASN